MSPYADPVYGDGNAYASVDGEAFEQNSPSSAGWVRTKRRLQLLWTVPRHGRISGARKLGAWKP